MNMTIYEFKQIYGAQTPKMIVEAALTTTSDKCKQRRMEFALRMMNDLQTALEQLP